VSKVETREVERLKSLEARVLAICQGKFSEANSLFATSPFRNGYLADDILQGALSAKVGDIANCRVLYKMAETDTMTRISWTLERGEVYPVNLLDVAF